jgi:type VI protein secretion system component VasF
MHFAERFFEILQYALKAGAAGPDRPPWAEVSRKLLALLQAESALPLPKDFTAGHWEQARFPILVWIDEYFMTSRRPDAGDWYEFSLQRGLLNTNLGGELFFVRLEALLKKRLATYPREERNQPGDEGGEPEFTLSQLWVRPGEGAEPDENILDCFALGLILGFKGRLASNASRARIEALGQKAREQIRAWMRQASDYEGEPVPAAPPGFGSWFRKIWADFGLVIIHIIIPTLVTLAIYLQSLSVVNRLIF